MLQLSQAYRYENFANSPLRRFLLNRACKDETLAYTLHWHVKLEKKNEENGPEMVEQYKKLFKSLMEMLEKESPKIYENILLQVKVRTQLLELSNKVKENKKEKL